MRVIVQNSMRLIKNKEILVLELIEIECNPHWKKVNEYEYQL